MKKLLIGLAAAAAFSAGAASVSAQSWEQTGSVDSYDWQITQAARDGRISWGEARNLHSQLASVKPLAWRVHTGQASWREHARVERTVDRIQNEIGGNSYRGYHRRYYNGWRR